MDNSLQYFRISKLYDGFVSSTSGRGRYFFMLDIALNVAKWSPEAVTDFALPGEYVHHHTRVLQDILTPEDAKEFEDDLEAIRKRRLEKKETVWNMKNRNGERVPCSVKFFMVKDYAGMPAYLAAVITSQGVETHTDPTTSLPNQVLFLDYLRSLFRNGRNAVVLLIGTSNFAEINSLYGYTFGNRVIAALAEHLGEITGDQGKLFRGDGTMLLFCSEELSADEICKIYNNQKNYAAQLLTIDQTRVSVRLSAGVVVADQSDVDVHAILACARYARNKSETEADGAAVVLKNDYLNHNEATLELVNAIRRDVENECVNFSIHYQPILSAKENSLVGCEAFLRWESENYGDISPADFLLWLENDVSFLKLGNWILRRAVSEGKQLLTLGNTLIININLAQRQLEQPEFHQQLLSIMKKYELPGRNLCLELTDRCRHMNPEFLRNEVIYLKSCGIRVALDGSCLLDLRLVRDLPVDIIKIGRDMIQSLKKNEKEQALLKALCDFAAQVGIQVCAEGVEDEQTLELIKEFGIYAYQGYLASAPVPFETFRKMKH